MYVPPAFRVNDDLPALHGTMRESRLASFVTATAEGLIATPLPLFLAPQEGPYGTIYGHVARANAQWKLPPIGDAMALFMGPDAYVSPSWYSSKQEHQKAVPTWNYVAVHAYGPVEFFEDPDRLLEVVTQLTNLHEQNQLMGIVGLRLPITRLDGKRKMSQNRSAEDRAGVAAGLAASEDASDRVVGELML